jgi:hypothetical protein
VRLCASRSNHFLPAWRIQHELSYFSLIFQTVNFRRIMWSFRHEYQTAKLKNKPEVAAKVVLAVAQQRPSGRFLECYNDIDMNEPHKPGTKTNWRYYKALPSRVHNKVSSTLRSKTLRNPFGSAANATANHLIKKDTNERKKVKNSNKDLNYAVKTKNRTTGSTLASNVRKGLFAPGLTFTVKACQKGVEHDTDTAPESSSSEDEQASPPVVPK